MLIDWTLGALIGAFCLFLIAAFYGQIRLGRLNIHPGWLGFAIWGLLAAIRAFQALSNQ